MANEDRLMDARVVERNIQRGMVKRADYDKFLDALPDVTKSGTSMDIEPLGFGTEEEEDAEAVEAETAEA